MKAVDLSAAELVLERACERHGGTQRFAQRSRVELTLYGLEGFVPWFKGLGRSFPSPGRIELWPHERRAVFHDYPRPGSRGLFVGGRVAVGADTSVSLEAPLHRESFMGTAKWRLWSPADALYFFGYALLDYVSLPFLLRGLEVIDLRSTDAGSELWVRFPPGTETHGCIQGFFFDSTGLLVRHDYRAEIIGAVFNGAHLSSDYEAVDGVLLATRRVVRAKLWHYPVRARLGFSVLRARLAPAR